MARTIRLRSQTHVPEMALLGTPSARFPNANVVSAPSSAALPTHERARVRAQAAAALLLALRDAMPPMRRPALMRQRASQPLCVCVCCTSRPSPATKYRSLSSSPSLCLAALSPFLPSPPSSLHTKPTPSHTQPFTHITMSTRSTRKRKNEEEELVELPEDSDAESEEE